MTLSTVREVFGQETENQLDPGVSEHGDVYTPTIEGSVVYRFQIGNYLRSPAPPSLATGATFGFKLRPPQPGTEAPRKIVDDDVVEGIEISEAQRRLLEK
jgi:hypothetical protein